MRWSDLFADLEARLEAEERAERRAEVADRTRRELAALTLLDRLLAAEGHRVDLRLTGGTSVAGQIQDVGKDWLALEGDGGRALLVPVSAIQVVAGLGGRADQREGGSRRRFGIGVALRELSRDRAPVRLLLADGGTLDGVVARVGADHLDLLRADREPGRRAPMPPVCVPVAAVIAVVSRG